MPVPGLEWVERGGAAALLIRLGPGEAGRADGRVWAERLPVYPSEVLNTDADAGPVLVTSMLQSMAGTYAAEAPDSVVFSPRFPFNDGVEYAVIVGGGGRGDAKRRAVLRLRRPARAGRPVTAVAEIHPVLEEIPRNVLRVYVEFSAPMSEGYAADCLSVRRADTGRVLADTLLPPEPELWDPERRRLTVLFDPARIKRGLVPHRERGYPLVEGEEVEIVVDAGFRDAAGRPLTGPGHRRYRVGPELRGRVDPTAWTVPAPAPGTRGVLEVGFGRPLDTALLARGLRLLGPDSLPLPGRAGPGSGGLSWFFVPDHQWTAGVHRLVVDPVLEDVAGNSVRRVFDRDLDRADEAPSPAGPVEIILTVA